MLRDEGDLGVDEVGQDRVAHRKSIRGLGFVQRWILESHRGINILQSTGERFCYVRFTQHKWKDYICVSIRNGR